MSEKLINTERFSRLLRERTLKLEEKRVLISNFRGSLQEKDLTEIPNCGGYGRIRHFRRRDNPRWPSDPLPIEPAQRVVKETDSDFLRTQVFQLASCNWRCWFCYVDYKLLSADTNYSSWFMTDDLVEMFEGEINHPNVIDLTGGQPDLVPEWIPWFMKSLRKKGLDKSTYLWSDDNLSTDYFWRFLTDKDIEIISTYENYGRVGCFKGFDDVSFSFNTGAAPELFDNQFELMKRLLSLGLDLYGYAIFTTPAIQGVKGKMARFIDKLQDLVPNFPLRTVPLEVKVYQANYLRSQKIPAEVIENQYRVVDAWINELISRYSSKDLETRISEAPLRYQKRTG